MAEKDSLLFSQEKFINIATIMSNNNSCIEPPELVTISVRRPADSILETQPVPLELFSPSLNRTDSLFSTRFSSYGSPDSATSSSSYSTSTTASVPRLISCRSHDEGSDYEENKDDVTANNDFPTSDFFCVKEVDDMRSKFRSFGTDSPSRSPSFLRPKMIVFDKDGTLGNDQESLRKWVTEMSRRTRQTLVEAKMSSFYGSNVLSNEDIDSCLQQIHASIGWDAANESLVRGMGSALLAAGTWEEIISEFVQPLAELLDRCRPTCQNRIHQLVSSWHSEVGSLHAHDEPLADLPRLIRECKSYGLKVAVCTSDDRRSTDQALKYWDIDQMIDYSICGDEVTNGKPSAEPLQILCQQAGGVFPAETIVVGDTLADCGVAVNAGAGFMIGVESGSSDREVLLEGGADLVLSDVTGIPIFLKSCLGLESKCEKSFERTMTASTILCDSEGEDQII